MELSKKIIQITCMSFNHGFIYAKQTHILDILSKQQYVFCWILRSDMGTPQRLESFSVFSQNMLLMQLLICLFEAVIMGNKHV